MYLAGVYSDPVLEWQARELAATAQKKHEPMEGVVHRRCGRRPGARPMAAALQPKSPAALDGSRWFPDIGWVAMHSALGDAANDVWAMFKASRFGSYSHSHADQNTFQLNAYGHALAIDSGYYPSYGTPHDDLWTRQTMAHNGILVNGRGQAVFKWEADGQIEDYARQGAITMVRGQAANGYNVEQPREVVNLWRKLIAAPLPAMEPKVETAERTLAFVASRTRPVLVVHDYIRTGAPASFDWLLHALNRMETDAAAGAVYVRDGDARMARAAGGHGAVWVLADQQVFRAAGSDHKHRLCSGRREVHRPVALESDHPDSRAGSQVPGYSGALPRIGKAARNHRIPRRQHARFPGRRDGGGSVVGRRGIREDRDGDAGGEGRLLVKESQQGSQAVAR